MTVTVRWNCRFNLLHFNRMVCLSWLHRIPGLQSINNVVLRTHIHLLKLVISCVACCKAVTHMTHQGQPNAVRPWSHCNSKLRSNVNSIGTITLSLGTLSFAHPYLYFRFRNASKTLFLILVSPGAKLYFWGSKRSRNVLKNANFVRKFWKFKRIRQGVINISCQKYTKKKYVCK